MWRAVFCLPLVAFSCLTGELEYKVEAVSAKHKFLEGPVWSAKEGFLLFNDVPTNTIHKIDNKGPSVFRESSGGASGSAFDDKGRLYICESRARRVIRIEKPDKKEKIEVLADQFEGKKLNGPNDITVTKSGHAYFTDPAFGAANDARELPFYGVFHISPKGLLSLALKMQSRPNGIAVSPDGTTLYISDSDERKLRSYRIEKDGTLTGEKVFVAKTDGVPAGIEVDEKGNVYVACNQIAVYTPGGESLTTITIAEKPSNMAFGDGNLQSLYVSARTTLYRVRFDTVKGVSLY